MDLEAKVNMLSQEFLKNPPKPGWVRKIVGSMKADAEFVEILKLGQDLRQADRPE